MTRVILGLFIVLVFVQANFVKAKKPDFLDDDMMEMIKDDKMDCMKIHGTTEDVIEQASEGKIQNDKRITCYMNCLFTRLGMMDEDANMEGDMLISFLPDEVQDKASQILDKCNKIEKGEICERTYKIATCLQQNYPEMWFMV